MPHIFKLLGIGLLTALVFSSLFLKEASLDLTPERQALVASEPFQELIESADKIKLDDFFITPLANFEATALVLKSRRYRFDTEARISPVDLALGWGGMADPDLLSRLRITQGGRWYRWRALDQNVNRQEVSRQSANMHMIPSSEAIRRTLFRVKAGDVVSFSGYLVRVDRPDGWKWLSSLTRTDTGSGSCEIVWLKDLFIVR